MSKKNLKVINGGMSSTLSPIDVYNKIDKYVIGQEDAKRSVSIAFVNRERRKAIKNNEMRDMIIPKNILMVGPTGVGKTEIARSLAKIQDSPFLKVPLTRFTEVGYYGKDIESVINDIVALRISLTRAKFKESVLAETEKLIATKIFNFLKTKDEYKDKINDLNIEKFIEKIKSDKIFDFEILVSSILELFPDFHEIDLFNEKDGMESANPLLGGVLQFTILPMIEEMPILSKKKVKDKSVDDKKISVAKAINILKDIEIQKKLSTIDFVSNAIKDVENDGIIFLDEIDKVISPRNHSNRGEISREGVQRDMLPLIEGTTVHTKYGFVKTDHILFIAAGAFHNVSDNDLMPEIKGRFPVKVELKSLTVDDFVKILTTAKTNLIDQQIELFKSSEISLEFTNDSIKEIAQIAFDFNQNKEDLGARRLFSIIEAIMEDLNFKEEKNFKIDKDYISKTIKEKLKDNIKLDKFNI